MEREIDGLGNGCVYVMVVIVAVSSHCRVVRLSWRFGDTLLLFLQMSGLTGKYASHFILSWNLHSYVCTFAAMT